VFGIRSRAQKMMVAFAALALAAAFAVMTRGCGNPGEGTVHVDPRVAAKLGKYRGVPPSAYGKTKVDSIRTKSRMRNNRSPK
jgi:hypothetical protein